jgi:aconitate hydratase
MLDSFQSRRPLAVGEKHYTICALEALGRRHDLTRLPFAIKVLLENLLRHEDGRVVTADQVDALAEWDPHDSAPPEIRFTPSRVLLQDFTGVPALVDLAAMREAVQALAGNPARVNPINPVDLVIDHSVQVDVFGRADAAELNARLEAERNRERYAFLRWGQHAFHNFRLVPPDTGIVHQVNLEYLASGVCTRQDGDALMAFPDTLVGTDSHTTMINALGVLGWGVGGIEAEAAMLGQPLSLVAPQVVGVRLSGELAEGATATDLVLTITAMLREVEVVGKFVEFFGQGLDHLALADRATIANMAPEYGATCAFFPSDEETLRYLHLTGRSADQVALVEAYARTQGLFRTTGPVHPAYSEVIDLDLARVEPCLAGPRRPQDRVPLRRAQAAFRRAVHRLEEQRSGAAAKNRDLSRFQGEGGNTAIAAEEAHHAGAAAVEYAGQRFLLRDGAVVIAAITSCTNTSNPALLLAAGLVARRARQRGVTVRPWVKTSLAPGSQAVTAYLREAGLLEDLEALGFHLVGYGCTTCIGNSGPLPEPISEVLYRDELIAAAVISGNRNFEGRIHPQVQMNYLASPPLVVVYALTGTMDIDPINSPIAEDREGRPVFLRELWPSPGEVHALAERLVSPATFHSAYANVYEGNARWNALETPAHDAYQWAADSTYIRHPPFFVGMEREPTSLEPIEGARVLALLGDSVTTDHISPAGAIAVDSPAGTYLVERGVQPTEFNSYGARRGNHEVMMRGTFANIRLRNRLAPGREGGFTRHLPTGETLTIFEAAQRYAAEGVPLIVIAGKEYGTGSSRDWAAKGPSLLGVRAVLARSFERIHRSNLVGMGILPLEFERDSDLETLNLDGTERFTISLPQEPEREVDVVAYAEDGTEKVRFGVLARIDTPQEWDYFRHGGILRHAVRRLADSTEYRREP